MLPIADCQSPVQGGIFDRFSQVARGSQERPHSGAARPEAMIFLIDAPAGADRALLSLGRALEQTLGPLPAPRL